MMHGVNQAQHEKLSCFQCGTELSKGMSAYCANCLAKVQLEFEQRAKECQKMVDEMQSKLLARTSLEAALIESLAQEKILAINLEQKVAKLSQELAEIRCFFTALQGLGVALNEIGGKLKALEQAQHQDTGKTVTEASRRYSVAREL